MAENPSSAASWQETPILELRQRFWETTSNMCMFGMIGKGGQPLFKLVRWVATHPWLIAAMDRHCDHMHAHEPVAGGNAKMSAAYPLGVADAILGALWDIADDEDYGSSCLGTEVREVYYVEPVMDEQRWNPILDGAMEILARKNTNAAFAEEGTGLWNQVADLVPWQLLSIQLAYLPKAKRTRPELGYTLHRCSVMRYTDDSLGIETRAPLLLHRYCYTDPISTLQQFAARIGVSARDVLCHSSRKWRNAVVIVFLLHSVFGSSPVAKSPRAHTPHCAFRLSPVISELWSGALLCEVGTLGMTCWH